MEFQQNGGPHKGSLRAVWPAGAALELYPALGTNTELDQFGAFTTADLKRYATPMLRFEHVLEAEPDVLATGEPIVNVGTQVFLSKDESDPYDYVVQVVSAYQSMLEFIDRLRTRYFDSSQFYSAIFVRPPVAAWGRSFTVNFDANWAYGGHGGITLYRPDLEAFSSDADHDGVPDGASPISWLLSGTGTLGHEFGHAAHGGLAGRTLTYDYAFANAMQRADGQDYDWGHGPG